MTNVGKCIKEETEEIEYKIMIIYENVGTSDRAVAAEPTSLQIGMSLFLSLEAFRLSRCLQMYEPAVTVL